MTAIYVILGWIGVSIIGAVIWTAIVRGHKRAKAFLIADDCPSVALADHGDGYACELDGGHPLPHRNGVWVWDIGDDVVIDLGAVGDLAAAVNRETLGIWPSPVEPTPTLREESIRCQSRYHYGLTDHYLCDLDPGHPLPHADSRGQARVRWYGTDERVTL